MTGWLQVFLLSIEKVHSLVHRNIKMVTKLNVNIRTLLTNCEELAKDETNFWRLKKFIKSLDTMIAELIEYDDPHNTSKIQDYLKRLQELKTLTKFIDSPQSTNSLRSKISRPALETSEDAVKEMRQLQNSKQYADLRKDLLNEDTLRRRKPDDAAATDNMNEAVKYYSEAQEKITEHMLSLTRNLKEQTVTANRIIKRDTETVSNSTNMADRNISSLHKETEKLEDHSRNAWKCWMWMMIVFVIVVFIGMVLFMKIMKKKKA